MKQKTNQNRMTAKTAHGRFSKFRKDEDGGMIIFSLVLFVLILTFGGMGVDLMRFETTRAQLQASLDRCTLAAADLDQALPPADVCKDYMTKAGMIQFLDGEPIVEQGINYRRVTANAQAEMPLFFYDLPRAFMTPFTSGLTTLTVSGSSTAEERVSDVEVSSILDVSGSMASNNRIENLRPAARDFVTTVLANNTNAPQGLITISMIPYSAVVNPGTDIVNYLDANGAVNRAHFYSTCLLFDSDIFDTTELDLTTTTYEHVSHFDPDWVPADAVPIADPWCHVGNHNAIVTHSTNESDLHTAITALEPYGNTAIDMGMKWGVGLLDPSTRGLITTLAAAPGNSVPTIAAGRPEDHGLADVLKVVVLMTDGSNTKQYDLWDRFKWDNSFIWFNLNTVNQPLQNVGSYQISVQYRGLDTPDNFRDDKFFNADPYNRWEDYPAGFSSRNEYEAFMLAGPDFLASPGVGPTYNGTVRNASWQELYATWEHNRVNNELLSLARNKGAIPNWDGSEWVWNSLTAQWERIYHDDYQDADNAINYNVVNSSEADDRLSEICQAARDEGVIIYTVAFEAPSGGQAALRDCASSPTHYFDVSGTDISEAFSAIASDIRSLKLTR